MRALNISRDLHLPLDAEPETQTFGILAKRGVGKTYTASVLAEELLKAKRQIVVADPIGVWHGLRSSADGKRSGLPIYVFGGESRVRDLPLEVHAGELIADVVVDQRVSVVLDLSLFRKHEQVTFMTAFSERLYHKNRDALHLFLDEADAFAPQKPPRGAERMLGAVEDLVRRGRARGIGVTLITQRSAVLNKDVLTQIEVLVALRTISPQDRAAIDAWIEVHGTQEQRRELMATLPALPVGTAWFWSPGWPTSDGIFQRVRVRERETFDSSATPKSGERRVSPKVFASVDLAALKEKMSATIERAKADDPKALRAEITRLNTYISAFKKTRASETQKVQIIREKVKVVEDVQIKRLEKVVDRLNAISGTWNGTASQVTNIAMTIASALRGAGATGSAPAPVRAATPAANRHRPSTAPASVLRRSSATVRSGEPRAPSDLGPGERATLIAIAQSDGATREQLSILTGYKATSRNTYLQRLRSQGLIDQNGGGEIIATPSGLAALGDDYEPLPTGDALRAYWLGRLKGGEREIFRVLVDAYPNALSRADIGERTGYKATSVNTYLQRLGARRLVGGGREIKATDGVFA